MRYVRALYCFQAYTKQRCILDLNGSHSSFFLFSYSYLPMSTCTLNIVLRCDAFSVSRRHSCISLIIFIFFFIIINYFFYIFSSSKIVIPFCWHTLYFFHFFILIKLPLPLSHSIFHLHLHLHSLSICLYFWCSYFSVKHHHWLEVERML